MSSSEQGQKNQRSRFAIVVSLLLGLAITTVGCSLVYSEVATPIRNPTADEPIEPAAPDDIFT
jgi:hypothetical protein